jgi:hypothetical protein
MQERKKFTFFGRCKSNSMYDLTVCLKTLIKNDQAQQRCPNSNQQLCTYSYQFTSQHLGMCLIYDQAGEKINANFSYNFHPLHKTIISPMCLSTSPPNAT